MEADWEFEIGGDAPIIYAHWPGFVDLRMEPGRVYELEETYHLPGLAEALLRLNSMNSSFWTCKTDVFLPDPIDAYELGTIGEDVSQLITCYVDLLPRRDQRWDSPSRAEKACTDLCTRLREVPFAGCRVDLVVRRADIEPDLNELGATAYMTACGATESVARSQLAECLSLFAKLIVPEPE